MTRKDIYAPETWRELYEETLEDVSMMLGYSSGISDVAEFVKNLPKDLSPEEFQAQILDLCSRAEATSASISETFCYVPDWAKKNFKQK